MAKVESRLKALEAKAGLWDKGPVRVFLLDEAEPLPAGVDADASDVMVIRLVGGPAGG